MVDYHSMADNQFDKSAQSPFSDAAIRRFLLGQLNAIEQAVFEEHLFTDDELEVRVRLAEIDLADNYASERLARADEERVRQNFLLSADRKQTLVVSKALRNRFAAKTEPQSGVAQKLKTLFGLSQPVRKYAFAALLLLLVFATVWRGIKEPRLVERIITKGVVPKPKATQTSQGAHHPTMSSSPAHVEQTPTLPVHETIASIIVLGPESASDTQTIVEPPKDDNGVVRFQLLLEKNQPGPYRAELLSGSGESIFSADSLEPADGSKINFDIPARVLKTGDHQIRLSRLAIGSTGNVATYHLRVQ